MSSMKKNVLAAALVAGLGLAGTAAAYNYGTALSVEAPALGGSADLADAEDVAIQQIFNESTIYTMQEDIEFIVSPGDTTTTGDFIIGRTTGFSFRIQLADQGALFACTPNLPQGAPPAGNVGTTPAPALTPVCASLASALVKGNHPHLADWDVYVEAGGAGANYVTIKVQPNIATPRGIPDGVIVAINEAQITNIAELRTAGVVVNANYLIGEPILGQIYPGSQKTVELLESVDAFECNTVNAGEPNKYIDVADHWDSPMVPKSRFSWDGKLGSSYGEDSVDSQYINFGNLTIDINNPPTSATFEPNDHFTTTLTGGANDDFDAFYNGPNVEDDDIYFVAANATCSSGAVLARSTIAAGEASAVFDYTWGDLGGLSGQTTITVKVCGYVDTDLVIDDTNITHTTLWLDRGGVGVSQGNLSKTCGFPPLRKNGSTMEVFYINPGGNPTQESFIRLTNRSAPRDDFNNPNDASGQQRAGGWVRIEGIDDKGVKAPTQASVWVPAGGSVNIKACELQNNDPVGCPTTKVVGGWGAPTGGKWRAVVTAEFPGLVAASFVRNTGGEVLTDVTDTDTRGEQYHRDWQEGTAANFPGERPSDYNQETTPDFHGDGQTNGPLGGPNDGTTPTGGSTDPNEANAPGNPGL